MLNNFVKMNLSIYERDTRYDRHSPDSIYEKSYFFPSKISNLLFTPNNYLVQDPKNILKPSLARSICIPVIFDFKHSWKNIIKYKITEDFELVAEKGKIYTFMEPENYFPDTDMCFIQPKLFEFIEDSINFNYDVTDIKLHFTDPKKEPIFIIIPGLLPHTCDEILYYLLEIQNYVNNQSSIYNEIFENLEINTGLEDIDSFFYNNLVLEHFKEWKEHGIPEEDEIKIVYNVIQTLIESFLGKDITKANISLLDYNEIQKYNIYREYFEGTKKNIILEKETIIRESTPN
jgi:hypothetical protein